MDKTNMRYERTNYSKLTFLNDYVKARNAAQSAEAL
jgi:hypothetical protein